MAAHIRATAHIPSTGNSLGTLRTRWTGPISRALPPTAAPNRTTAMDSPPHPIPAPRPAHDDVRQCAAGRP